MAEIRIFGVWRCHKCGKMNPIMQDERMARGDDVPVTCPKCGYKTYALNAPEYIVEGGGHYGHEQYDR